MNFLLVVFRFIRIFHLFHYSTCLTYLWSRHIIFIYSINLLIIQLSFFHFAIFIMFILHHSCHILISHSIQCYKVSEKKKTISYVGRIFSKTNRHHESKSEIVAINIENGMGVDYVVWVWIKWCWCELKGIGVNYVVWVWIKWYGCKLRGMAVN